MRTSLDLSTSFGHITLELFDDAAPQTVANFLRYVDTDRYDGTFLHRLVRNFVLQGGGYSFEGGQVFAVPTYPPVPNEFGISNTIGTIAMAKLPNDPNSATSQFFFNLANNNTGPNSLDVQNGGFTVFGHVTGGWDVVQAIAGLPIYNAGGAFTSLPLTNYVSGPVQESNFVEILDVTRLGIYGTDVSELLTSGAAADVLFGLGGNDTLVGGDGFDQLYGGAGVDTAFYAAATAAVYADLRSGVALSGGVLLDSFDSIENLTGGSGDDLLVGDDGPNLLVGGAGSDELQGMGGEDVLVGGVAAPGGYNQLFGGTGSDTASYAGLAAPVRADIAGSGAYADFGSGFVLVDSYSSIENLVGGSGADVLAGDDGVNVITGGGGADVLYGRGGPDVFVYGAAAQSSVASGYDTVIDFASGEDRVDLSAFGIDASHVRIASNATSTALYADTDAGTAGYELAIAFTVPNAVEIGDIVF